MKELIGFKTSPLVTCIVEIRFKHNAGELVPGLVYSSISGRYNSPRVENLPILQLPQQIRENDPGTIFMPTNSIKLKNFDLNVGPRVLALVYDISSGKRYPQWHSFHDELKLLSGELGGIGLFKNIERIGVRYVNFFQTNDFIKNLQVSFNTPWEARMEDEINFNFLLKNEASKTRVTISTNATLNTVVKGVQKETKQGQILDTDTFVEGQVRYQDFLAIIDNCHKEAKRAFIECLNEDFIATLGPDYA